jgi:succinate dehydrogenase / fumarate reductase iron-sulfur subunit
VNINGKNDLFCVQKTNDLPQRIMLRPLLGLRCARSDRRLRAIFQPLSLDQTCLIINTPLQGKERLQTPEERDELDDLYE